MCKIEFHILESEFDRIPHPYPASRHVPDWFKNMPPDWEQGGTLKRCPPFLTAMTAGYIVPVPFDLQLNNEQGVITFQSQHQGLASAHFFEQYRGAPFAGRRVVKFHNPWIIVTPQDYVSLITAPINRFQVPLLPLTGIVETGSYYKEVQLPMVCMLGPGQSCLLRRGDPMIQIIPMRAEPWTSQIGYLDASRRASQQAGFDVNRHEYKDKYWRKLEFS